MLHRLLSKLPLYNRHIAKTLASESAFYQQNRIRVLLSYRHLLKLLPKIYPRTLQQAQKINEMRWIYKQSKQLPTIEEVEGRTRLATQLVEELSRGEYRRLGELVPHRFVKQYTTTNEFFADHTPRKPKWWRGHIY